MINCIYRISDKGYPKEKPGYIGNTTCFFNFISVFGINHKVHVIADNCSDATISMLHNYSPIKNPITIETCNVGNGAGTFNLALDLALSLNNDDIVYFIENDYVHLPDSDKIIEDGLINVGAHFVTLYDHPDKYMDPKIGGNPLVINGGEITQVYLGKYCHWKLTNSTTMTFACKGSTLKQSEDILRHWTNGPHPHDFQMFLDLRAQKYSLISPIPSYSTHGETRWLAPLVDWEKEMLISNKL